MDAGLPGALAGGQGGQQEQEQAQGAGAGSQHGQVQGTGWQE